MTLQTAFDNFILEKRLQGLSADSIKSYENIIFIFLHHIGGDMDISALTREMVNDYILSLQSRNIDKSTIATYVRNARIFLCWVYTEYDLSFDPHKIRVPKSPKKQVHLLSDTEIGLIFNAIHSSFPWISARNRAIVALMLDSGIRQGEVCGLLRENMDYDRMMFKVTGKGAKDRLVPLGMFAKSLLSEYMALCPYRDAQSVFVDRYGKQISRNAIRLFVNRLKHDTGIDFSSHKFRHNFATNYCIDNLQRTGNSDVYDLSILMGHESVETTKRYEHFAHELVAVKNHSSHLDDVFREQISMSGI